ncbi:class I SAM-dependent methyltransferase [Sphingobacterium oryzagri]|uniref:Class I SAM-dependent methyltransferase n=1 Tax=Sphingobacterium oryzagri TaxID=3025669 RepID=A0ABY7WNH0_9SPHI|nr:class I SAM-dependent methyltransferase [Sphingobacterium sp. KACC 22765]WDF70089.1 class I SAM-dependent methyltransferase [Sphingobacterium sp. KACC 22765]
MKNRLYKAMNHHRLISDNIVSFYTKASEETRLEKGMGIFEFERIKILIQKYIPCQKATILDIGGGTGKYAAWLAAAGHQVHLIDPVLKHIGIARHRSSKLKNKFSVHLGEARQLDFPDHVADLIILHGPLYHLPNEYDRALAIKEAKRVLKYNGIILGFAISYTASTLVGLTNGLIHKRSFFRCVYKSLRQVFIIHLKICPGFWRKHFITDRNS